MIDDGNVPSRRTLSAEVDHTPQTMRRSLLSLVLSVAVLPVGWPHHLALGLRESPGEANRIAHSAPLDLRSQYLAGGVKRGAGRASWNPNGSFASMYVSESIAQHMIPVLTYYQLLESAPARGSGELQKDLSNLRNAATMRLIGPTTACSYDASARRRGATRS